MSFFNRLSPTRATIPNTIVFTLTATGKSKAEEYRGLPKDRVLVSLDENGASTIKDIADDTGLRRTTVEIIIRQLLRGGLIHSIKGETE